MHGSSSRSIPTYVLALLALVGLSGCGQPSQQAQKSNQPAPGETADLPTARAQFVTKLKRRGPAPQEYQDAKPPRGVQLVEYRSGDLDLKGWLSSDRGDGKRHAAVVY